MPRTKGGVVARRRRNRVLKAAKGFWGSKHCLFKVANQQVMKGRQYAFRDRKNNKRNFRKLWIVRINAAARMQGLTYSVLMHGLKVASGFAGTQRCGCGTARSYRCRAGGSQCRRYRAVVPGYRYGLQKCRQQSSAANRYAER